MSSVKNKLIKIKVIDLRKRGYSVTYIAKTLGVAKSNVSLWVRNVVLTKKQRDALSLNSYSQDVVEKRRKTRLLHEESKRSQEMKLAGDEINVVDEENLKLIGVALYWAEGSKSKKRMVAFSNSDPAMIKLMMRFFIEVCKVDESKFRGHIHLHSDKMVKASENYWSKMSGIPLKHFYKTYAKKSIASKDIRRTLPFGTFDIYVNDVRVFLKIMGWIEKIKKITVR